MKNACIAVDFGGGSGRVIAGWEEAGRMVMEEVYRFRNRQVRLGGTTYWDFLSLYADMLEGLRRAAGAGYRIQSIGIDTWGVDFGLIGRHGELLGNPVCYRDDSVAGASQRFFSRHIGEAEHYSRAGIQIMDINTVYRLADMLEREPEKFELASCLLMMPDLFSYFLTGEALTEYTIATTTGLVDARTRDWDRELIRKIGLPEHLFTKIVMPGARRGRLTDDVKHQIGIDYDVDVVAVGSHDTASAVSVVEGDYAGSRTAYLSSGTWSLLGVKLPEPILTEEARLGGMTNEGAAGGDITLLQNITGLWILQSLIGEWEKEGLPTDYPHLLGEAENSSIQSVIDVDAPEFHNPRNMGRAIAAFCDAHGLAVPQTQGEIVKVVMLSLADRYRRGIEGLNAMLPYPIERLQVIGGGSRNELLNRLTAEATGVELIAGPVEATAIGNLRTQMRTND